MLIFNEVLILADRKIIVVTGHYGSGKTTLCLNLALDFKRRGRAVTLADLDIGNPYFCSAGFRRLLEGQGIELIASGFAGTNLDTPALTNRLEAEIDSGRYLIIDTGGDEIGARVLGRYRRAIAEAGYEMLYVVNACRAQTERPQDAAELLIQIEDAARLKATGIVNNTNLGPQTEAQTVLDSGAFAESTAAMTGLPLLFTAADRHIPGLDGLEGPVFRVEPVVRKPWESQEVTS